MTAKIVGRKSKTAGTAKPRGSRAAQGKHRQVGQSDFATEEIEFLEAMDRYQREARRPFPTWGEVLGVLHSLGYGKTKAANGPKGKDGRWRQLCAELKAERDRLQLELTKLRDDYDHCCKSLGILMRENLDFDKEEILARRGKESFLEQLIAELDSKGDKR